MVVNQLLELTPTHQEAAFMKGVILGQLQRRPEAVMAYRRTIRLNQYHAESTHNL